MPASQTTHSDAEHAADEPIGGRNNWLDPILIWFERRLDPFPDEEPEQPPTGFLAFCAHYTKGAWGWLSLLAASSFVVGVLEVMLFGFMGSIVDWLASVERGQLFASEGDTLLLFGAIALLVLPLTIALGATVQHQTLLGNYPMRIRWQVHRYLLGQSLGYFQDEFAGRVATKLMQTALAVRQVVMVTVDVFVYVLTTFTGVVVLLAIQDWRLSVPVAVYLVSYGVMLWLFIPRFRRVAEKQADARSTMTGRIVDSYTNIQTVKLFSHSRREHAYAREAMGLFLDPVHRQMRLGAMFDTLLNAMHMVALVATAWVALSLWNAGAIEVGAVAIALGIVLRLGGITHWVMWELSSLFENVGTVQDGINSIAMTRHVRDRPDAKPLEVTEGGVRFEGVEFAYDSGDDGDETNAATRRVVEHLDLDIRPGEKVGLVGRSGAGKSTLVNLLLRFYDVDEGRILIDGQDVSEVTQESLRGAIGVVTQDTSLLHRSVRENILYGRPDATEEEVWRAIRLAEAEGFVPDLRDPEGRTGLDAQVGERGVKLSGGQRQRIAIARMILKDAPILVLDEATSALDSEVEAAIQGSLERLMEGRTVVAIAHRLSTIAAMDRLVVMEEGRVIEEGTHDELIAAGGTYSRLWARQSGGFLRQDDEEFAAAAE